MAQDYLSDSDLSELAFDQSSDEEYTPYNNTVQSENESSAENSNDEGKNNFFFCKVVNIMYNYLIICCIILCNMSL